MLAIFIKGKLENRLRALAKTAKLSEAEIIAQVFQNVDVVFIPPEKKSSNLRKGKKQKSGAIYS